ncbi:MAG TPA: DUF456 domain-containing protein [Gemmatimonadaceae bacterium]|nr:DUF456 domain-containing protein [Gemmatimonadaceae bacterium]
MRLVLLALALLASLALVPLGLPGLWVMVGVALVHDLLVPAHAIGVPSLLGAVAVAAVAEVLEFLLGGRFARRYGGSRRAEWGAILGGFVGAFVGVPAPIVGPMIGAFAGAFVGALAAEYTVARDARGASRVALGALLGRAAAVAMKTALGFVLAIWLVIAAWQ